MAAGHRSSHRRERAPKPLSVPIVVAVIGIAVFLLGIAVSSYDISGLGMIFLLWGLTSTSVLLLKRRGARSRSAGQTR